MKNSSLVGLLVGSVVAIGAGVVYARERKPLPLQLLSARPPHFEYGVKQGDTLSALALRFFGDAAKRSAFRDDAGRTVPDDKPLLAGTVLRVPCNWYTVKSGDTLAKVAASVLGDATRWRRIAEANKDTVPDPDKLEVGQSLAVPDATAIAPEETAAKKMVAVGCAFDLVGAEVLGHGGHGGGGHHHGGGGRGRRGRGGNGGWYGGGLYYGPGWEIDEVDDGPDADDIADAVVRRLKKKTA